MNVIKELESPERSQKLSRALNPEQCVLSRNKWNFDFGKYVRNGLILCVGSRLDIKFHNNG